MTSVHSIAERLAIVLPPFGLICGLLAVPPRGPDGSTHLRVLPGTITRLCGSESLWSAYTMSPGCRCSRSVRALGNTICRLAAILIGPCGSDTHPGLQLLVFFVTGE